MKNEMENKRFDTVASMSDCRPTHMPKAQIAILRRNVGGRSSLRSQQVMPHLATERQLYPCL